MITVTRFAADGRPTVFASLAEAAWAPGAPEIVWLDLDGPGERELDVLSDPFQFHPLAIEDCLTPEHQPKIEDFGPYLFMIFRGIDVNPPVAEFQTIKLAAFIGPNYLVTYHRRPMRSVAAVRDRYAQDPGTNRFRGVDYLLYEILDHLIEHYFPVLDRIETEIDTIEDELFGTCGPETLERIMATRRRVQEVKRTLAPHRELFGRIGRNEFEEIGSQTVAFYRDLYDSTYRLTEIADSYRDQLAGMFDAYLSIVSQRLNEVMKVLTVMATIFSPITFIAGVWGMNFRQMPELEWEYGYLVAWSVFIAIALALLTVFKRRGWL